MRILTILAALAALAVVAGCGGEKKTIPNDNAASLIRALRAARDDAGDPQKCDQLQADVRLVQARVTALPASVDRNTRDSLVNGVNNLIDNARTECANVQTTPTTPETTPETIPQTTPETTPQTTPQTTPTTPQTTPTTPTTPTPPPSNGGAAPPGKGAKDKKKGKGD